MKKRKLKKIFVSVMYVMSIAMLLGSVYFIEGLIRNEIFKSSDDEVIEEVLNEYNIYGRVYQYTLGSSFGSIHSFKNCIATSLTCGKPVVLHADTYYLAYYNGNSYGHYLSLDVYDRRTETVRIVDCNYMTDYYGIHTVSVEEAYNCISASGRYLIH